MTQFTPTDEIRRGYGETELGDGTYVDEDKVRAMNLAEFDRWLAAHDAETAAKALEQFANDVRERYPEDVFTPIEADDHDHINAVLKTYVHISRDRISADVFRRAAAQADQAATEIRTQQEGTE